MKVKGIVTAGRTLLIAVSAVIILAIIDYGFFLQKTRDIELYDELNQRLNSVRVSATKLEYLLDMYVVASRFELNTIDVIREDVSRIDDEIAGLQRPEFAVLLRKSGVHHDTELSAIADDWKVITAELARLNTALSNDEVMLIHNSVDVNTILITEKADRFLAHITEGRGRLYGEIKEIAFASVVGFIVVFLASGLVFFKRVISPINILYATAGFISSGSLGTRFKTQRGIAGRLARALNGALEAFDAEIRRMDANISEAKAGSLKRDEQIMALKRLATLSASSISSPEVKHAAARELAAITGAVSVAIYTKEGDRLVYRASSGPDDIFRKAPEIGLELIPGASSAVYSASDEPCKSVPVMALGNIGEVAAVPVSYGNEASGLLLVAFKGNAPREFLPFIECAAALTGASAGHINMYLNELQSRRFFERLVTQAPFGVAAFDRAGLCVMVNSAMKAYPGMPDKGASTGRYSLADDRALSVPGGKEFLRRVYDGAIAEFVLGAPETGPAYRVRGYPLYDQGGEVGHIALVYEPLSGAPRGKEAVK